MVSCDFCVIPAANACWRHCRLSWHEAALTRHNQKTPIRTPIKTRVRAPRTSDSHDTIKVKAVGDAKFYGVLLWFTSWWCHDIFLNIKTQCVTMALELNFSLTVVVYPPRNFPIYFMDVSFSCCGHCHLNKSNQIWIQGNSKLLSQLLMATVMWTSCLSAICTDAYLCRTVQKAHVQQSFHFDIKCT